MQICAGNSHICASTHSTDVEALSPHLENGRARLSEISDEDSDHSDEMAGTNKRAETAPTVPTLNEHRLAGRHNINPTHMELMMQTNIMPATGAATVVLCHREEADNYDRVLVSLSDDWRIIECKDAIQFITQRKSPGGVVGARWRNIRYHRTRDTLTEACHRSGIFPTPDPAAAIAALPAICGRAQ